MHRLLMALCHPPRRPWELEEKPRAVVSHLPLNFLFLYNVVTFLYIRVISK